MSEAYTVKRESLYLKIERLIEFVREYPEYWGAGNKAQRLIDLIEDDKERERFNRLYNKVFEYYQYIKRKSLDGRLTKMQIERLSEGEVGREIVPNSEKLEEDKKRVISECGLSEEVADKIIYKYGSFDNFRNAYMKLLREGKVKDFISESLLLNIRFVEWIDISEDRFEFRDQGYIDLLKDVFSNFDRITDDSIFVDGKRLKNYLDEIIGNFSERDIELLKRTYNLGDGKKSSRNEIAKEYGITPQRVTQIYQHLIRVLEKTINPEEVKGFFPKLSSDFEKHFLRNYFEKHDIYYTKTDKKNKFGHIAFLEETLISYISGFNFQEMDSDTAKEFIKKLNDDITVVTGNNQKMSRNLFKRILAKTRILEPMILYSDILKDRDQHSDYSSLFPRMLVINPEYSDDEKQVLKRTIQERRERLNDENVDYFVKRIEKKSAVVEEISSFAIPNNENGALGIELLDLPPHIYRNLKRNGINTIIDWKRLPEENESNTGKRSFSPSTRAKIEAKFYRYLKSCPNIQELINNYDVACAAYEELERIGQEINVKYLYMEAKLYLLRKIVERKEILLGYIGSFKSEDKKEDDQRSGEEIEINEDLREKLEELKQKYRSKVALSRITMYHNGKLLKVVKCNRRYSGQQKITLENEEK